MNTSIIKIHKRLITPNQVCYCYLYNISVLVAQWTRARGYEPRCRGFESLLAQDFLLSRMSKKLDIILSNWTIIFLQWGVAKW